MNRYGWKIRKIRKVVEYRGRVVVCNRNLSRVVSGQNEGSKKTRVDKTGLCLGYELVLCRFV